MKVLVVRFGGPILYDDDFEMCLRSEGISYVPVAGRTLPPELPRVDVIVQVGLDAPPDAGLVLVERLRALAPNTPLVVCSTDGRQDIHNLVRSMGATFIRRPITAQELLDQVKLLMQNKTAP